VDTTQTITHLGLCAGYGGIELGLKRVLPTMRTVALCEIEAFAIANLVAKMEAGLMDPAPIWTDLKTFPWEEFRDKVDVLSGGFPCQPFSSAGKRAGDEDGRHLFPYILEGIRQCRPSVVFLENVEGIISSKLVGDHWNDPAGTPVLLHVLRELERVGYKATAGVFSASECGASHQRKRVFIMAHLRNKGLEGYISGLFDTARRKEPSGSTAGCSGSGRSGELANANGAGSRQDWESGQSRTDSLEQPSCTQRRGNAAEVREGQAWPARPGQPQHAWEPPRVVGNASWQGLDGQWDNTSSKHWQNTGIQSGATDGNDSNTGEIEQSLGRNFNESSSRLDYAKLCVTCDNRTDELRLLGNGVVPATAELAFRTLWNQL